MVDSQTNVQGNTFRQDDATNLLFRYAEFDAAINHSRDGEQRNQGETSTFILLVVYTRHHRALHVISAWAANANEAAICNQHFA